MWASFWELIREFCENVCMTKFWKKTGANVYNLFGNANKVS